jgi:hypothetical protein
MTKRITCKVIRSVPLNKATDRLMRSDQLSSKHSSSSDVAAVNIRIWRTNNSVAYANRLNKSKVAIDRYPVGQILDCYV